jgi:DNA-binding NarL/FixJ family response regulator
MRSILRQFGPDVTILEACDFQNALATAGEHPDLDLVLLGLNNGGKGSTCAIADLRACRAGLRIIVVAPHVAQAEMMSAFACGARGYVLETVSQQVFLQAVRLVFSGGVYIPKEFLATGTPVAGERGPHIADGSHTDIRLRATCHAGSLTPKQAQVLELMAQGKSNKLIGRELRLAPGTVKAHVSGILRALNVRNRTQAAVAAGAAIGAPPLATHAAQGSHIN